MAKLSARYLTLLNVLALTLLVSDKFYLDLLLRLTLFQQSRLLSVLFSLTRPFSLLFRNSRTAKLFLNILHARSFCSFSSYYRAVSSYQAHLSGKASQKLFTIFPPIHSKHLCDPDIFDFSTYHDLPVVILGPSLDLTDFDVSSITGCHHNLILLSNLNLVRPLGGLSTHNHIVSFYNNAVAKRIPHEISHLINSRILNSAIFRTKASYKMPIYDDLSELYTLSHQPTLFPISSLMGLPSILAELLNNPTFVTSRKIYVYGFSMLTGPQRYSSTYGNLRGSDVDLESLRVHDPIAQYLYISYAISKLPCISCDQPLRSILNSTLNCYLDSLDQTYAL